MKKILTGFIVLISLGIYQDSKSCGWGPYPEEYRVYLFDSELSNTQNLCPWFYSTDFLNDCFYESWGDVPSENIEEWISYGKNSYGKDDIKELVYETSLENLLRLSKLAYPQVDSLLDNKMIKYIIYNKRKDIADYLVFARKVEELLYENDPWEENKPNTKALEKLIKKGKKKAEKSRDLWMKQRYAYQVIVIMRYIQKYQEAISYYNNTFRVIPSNEESVLKYWSLSHVATCQMYLGFKKESQLNFVKTFVNCNAKKYWAYIQMDRKFLDSLIQSGAVEDMYSMRLAREFKNPGRALDGLKVIAKENPNSEMLRTLLVREVNKLEDWLLTSKYTVYPASINYWSYYYDDNKAETRRRDLRYLEQVIGFMESHLQLGRIAEKGLWELILAHLYFIYDSPSMALTYLNRAEKNVTTELQQRQVRYTRILVNTIAAKTLDTSLENKIYKDITWLEANETLDKDNRSFSNLLLALHSIYHERGDYARAALFMAKDIDLEDRWRGRWWDYKNAFFYLDEFGNVDDVKEFIKIVDSGRKTDLEEFLLREFRFEKNRYLDLVGTKYLRKDNLKSAKLYYEMIPKDFWMKHYWYKYYLSKNPFKTYDYSARSSTKDTVYVNKAYFVDKLIEKKKDYQRATGVRKAEYAEQLAIVYYNMTSHGACWYYKAYAQGNVYTRYNEYVDEEYQYNYKCVEYYKKAYQHHTDPYRKAEALYDAYIMEKWKKEQKNSEFAVLLKRNYPERFEFYTMLCPRLEHYAD